MPEYRQAPRATSPYDTVDWDQLAAEEDAYYAEHPEELARVRALDKKDYETLPAAGGPYEGMELHCPTGGTTVIVPAQFGRTGDLRGQVIYVRVGDRMVFQGQPQQPVPEDDYGDDAVVEPGEPSLPEIIPAKKKVVERPRPRLLEP